MRCIVVIGMIFIYALLWVLTFADACDNYDEWGNRVTKPTLYTRILWCADIVAAFGAVVAVTHIIVQLCTN